MLIVFSKVNFHIMISKKLGFVSKILSFFMWSWKFEKESQISWDHKTTKKTMMLMWQVIYSTSFIPKFKIWNLEKPSIWS